MIYYVVIRTHDEPKNPYIPIFLRTVLGPDYYICTPVRVDLVYTCRDEMLCEIRESLSSRADPIRSNRYLHLADLNIIPPLRYQHV